MTELNQEGGPRGRPGNPTLARLASMQGGATPAAGWLPDAAPDADQARGVTGARSGPVPERRAVPAARELRRSGVTMPERMPTFTSQLRRTEESAAQARQLVTGLLAAWDLAPLAEDAALIVTELVANAVAHGRGPSIRLTVTFPEQKLVRLAVTDNNHGKPQVTAPGPDDESGRGLQIVAALSRRWGVDFRPRHKHVWAEVTQ